RVRTHRTSRQTSSRPRPAPSMRPSARSGCASPPPPTGWSWRRRGAERVRRRVGTAPPAPDARRSRFARMAGSWIAPPDQPPPAVHLGAVGFEPERGAVVGVVAAGPDLHHRVQRHVADRVDALDLALADPSDPAALVQQVAASGLPVLVSLPVLASTSAASALEGACGAGAAGVRTPAATASDELLAQAVA